MVAEVEKVGVFSGKESWRGCVVVITWHTFSAGIVVDAVRVRNLRITFS